MTADRLEEMARDRQILAKSLRYCRHRSGSVRKLQRAYICTGCAFDALAQARREGAEAERARAERIVREMPLPMYMADVLVAYKSEFLRRLKASE